jgi:hypothetical protein
MKLAWIAAALLAATTLGCEKEPSKLDKVAAVTPPAGGEAGGDIETRIARLEKKLQGVDRGALDLLVAAYNARVEEEENKPKAGVIYGIDIAQNVQIGQVEGAPDALVTIVEAFDFA